MDVCVWWGGVEERGETAVDGLVGCYLPPPPLTLASFSFLPSLYHVTSPGCAVGINTSHVQPPSARVSHAVVMHRSRTSHAVVTG